VASSRQNNCSDLRGVVTVAWSGLAAIKSLSHVTFGEQNKATVASQFICGMDLAIQCPLSVPLVYENCQLKQDFNAKRAKTSINRPSNKDIWHLKLLEDKQQDSRGFLLIPENSRLTNLSTKATLCSQLRLWIAILDI